LKTEPLISQNFSRILLIKPSAVGDVVHAIPLLPKLRARFPYAQIDWFITPENAELVRHHPALTDVVLVDRKRLGQFGRSWDATKEALRVLGQLRGARYDLVIDLHGQFRSALYTLATGAHWRIGFDRPVPRARTTPWQRWTGAREGSWVAYSHRIPIPTLEIHAIDRYLWVAPLLGLDDDPPDGRIYLSPDTENAVEQLLGRDSVRNIAALVPGTRWETKHWDPDRFAEVGRWLRAQGFDVVILGTQDDQLRCEKIAALCGGSLNLCGKTTLGELAGILKRSAVCLTNDSGSMHLAVAFGRPVVSVFGPTNPLHIGPYGRPEAVVRSELPCSPCNFRLLAQCPHGHACMKRVTVSDVICRVEAILNS
jgi:heptosyltransferase-1